jgi:hypothetical protein
MNISMSRAVRAVAGWTLSLAAAAAVVGPMTHQAHGQVFTSIGGAGGFAGPGGPGGTRISRAALDRYSALLNLDQAQSDALAALHEAYTEQSRAASKVLQARLKELEADLQEGDGETISHKIPTLLQQHGQKAAEDERAFLDDVKAILTPAQAEQGWPRVERLRRREQWLRSGVLSGSNVDLVTVVEGLKLAEAQRAGLNETLEQYETDLDRVIQDIARAHADRADKQPARKAAGDDGGPRIMMFDAESMRERMKTQREESERLREVNQRYARLLSALLPEDLRPGFDEQFKIAAHRPIYRESQAQRRLAAAEKFNDLTEQQRQRLREIAENYRRQARAANERWAAAQEKAEAEGHAVGGPGRIMMMGGPGGQPDDLKDARQARRDLDSRVDADLDAVLNDDQKSRLPKQRIVRGGGPAGAMQHDVDVIADGDGHQMVFVSAVEGEELPDGEEGVVIARQVIVATSEETATTPDGKPAEKKDEKKEQKKDDGKK